MYLTTAEIDEQRNTLVTEMESIVNVAKEDNRDLTEDEETRVADITDNLLPKLDKQFDQRKKVEDRISQKIDAKLDSGELAIPAENKASKEVDPLASVVVPAVAKSRRSLKAFSSERAAYAFGHWLAASAGREKSRQWCIDNGFMNAMSEGTDSAGGFTVPDPLSAEIIRLVEQYGVFRQYARVVPMAADTLAVPRRTGGLTVYYPGENTEITSSDVTFAQANLTAKKYSALALMSSELDEDSVISMADLIADEIAYSFAVAEDTNGFKGDGTSTYASITGLENALLAGSVYDADSGETTVASLDFADYEAVIGMLPQFAGIQPAWYVNSKTYATSMCALMNAAGGNTIATLQDGATEMQFLGYPVRFSQVLDGDGASNVVAYFGDLSMAATMGNRRNVSIRTLLERYADKDQIGVVATARSAITVHEVGTASVAGPMIALKLAAS